MSCGVRHRCSSDPALLWLSRRPEASAPIRPLACLGTSICRGSSPRKGKKKKKNRDRKVICQACSDRGKLPAEELFSCSLKLPPELPALLRLLLMVRFMNVLGRQLGTTEEDLLCSTGLGSWCAQLASHLPLPFRTHSIILRLSPQLPSPKCSSSSWGRVCLKVIPPCKLSCLQTQTSGIQLPRNI